MRKYLGASLLILFLTACSEPVTHYADVNQVRHQLKLQNSLLQPLKNQTIHEMKTESKLPYSESYLKTRHEIYRSLNAMNLTPSEQQLTDYLSIAERFPARYFPWPANINVVENMLNAESLTEQQIVNWVEFTEQQLSKGLESKLKLSKLELNSLKSHITRAKQQANIPKDIAKALVNLDEYLADYIPRGSLGLLGLPNGAAWYQSKLNYFGQKTNPPLVWLTKIQSMLELSLQQKYTRSFSNDHSESLLEQWVNVHSDKLIEGLDWEQNYKNLPLSALALIETMTESDKVFWLAMMETDLGIHYHAWTAQQARVNLEKRVKLSSEQATYAVENLVYFPAFSFAFAPLLDKM
ncbi:hypothetical protein [Pseudoalteromonas sp. H105]|jgi:uncharacterized protein (DUF885 family)|uniref:hypothetical protein n=1 Tax=Pseudoalteromonas sp. H105 TaxID=1348393 RepID=UPI0007321503|nr:hypothetical protein [Pseudoalteromonas sp. H105]KTF14872.1 hypothetical protein ATS75_12270 [Pseudoalteromonas sp. H105]